jgi:hypothetical protein
MTHSSRRSSSFNQPVDIVSKNGNLLLNFGPRSDGTIQWRGADDPAGVWLKVNGEANGSIVNCGAGRTEEAISEAARFWICEMKFVLSATLLFDESSPRNCDFRFAGYPLSTTVKTATCYGTLRNLSMIRSHAARN